MTGEFNAVFLSYASEDSEAAQLIADALKVAGIEVWFDKSELRGGDAWDQKIRERIRDCALFVPIISANTDARPERYFRREWRLAAERAGDMADDERFVVPVVIDGTNEANARVPERFRLVQWSKAPAGTVTEDLSGLIVHRLAPAPTRNSTRRLPASTSAKQAGAQVAEYSRPTRAPPLSGLVLGLTLTSLLLLGGLWLLRSSLDFDVLRRLTRPATLAADASPVPSRAPPHGLRPMWIATPYIAVDFHHLLLVGFIPAHPIFRRILPWGLVFPAIARTITSSTLRRIQTGIAG